MRGLQTPGALVRDAARDVARALDLARVVADASPERARRHVAEAQQRLGELGAALGACEQPYVRPALGTTRWRGVRRAVGS